MDPLTFDNQVKVIKFTHCYISTMKVKVVQSCPTLCDPMDYKTVHGILQAKILESVAFPFSRGSSQSRDQTQGSHIAGRCFTIEPQVDPGMLEWVAYPFSSGSSQPRNRTRVSYIAGGFFPNWAIRDALPLYYNII